MSGATLLARVNTWIARVKSRTGRLPILYTSPGFWGYRQPKHPALYLGRALGRKLPKSTAPVGRLRFWQYSSTGKVSGISGNVDIDMYNGSLAELKGL